MADVVRPVAAPGAEPDAPDDSLVVLGLPKHISAKDIEKLLAAYAPGHKVLRVKPKPHTAVVQLASKEARDLALAALEGKGVVFKSHSLSFRAMWSAEEKLERHQQKRKAPFKTSEGADGDKRQRTAEEAVTPLHAVPYEEQLVRKADSIRDVLRELASRLIKAKSGGEWLSKPIAKANDGRVCELAPIVRAPVIREYRNKCEFTIGAGADGSPCVGFKLGQFKDGITAIGDPSGCSNVSREMKTPV
ncbi:hypothetical protein T492DRAFT_842586 [Pavlovales sp. CCMP2436]|nr:hypothetical protein T492DRAFT_842586 [Pavlovales sp. CCMP2436]